MKVTREKIENSQAFLKIEMEPAELEKYLSEAYHHLVKRTNIPGFRKGKAPRAILERHIGRQELLEHALSHLLPEASEQAIKEQGLEAIAAPSIEIEQTEPVVFRATVPLKPQVKLGDYHQIRVASETVEITDDNVNAVIEQLRRQNGTWEPAEREVKFDDLVTLDIESNAGGQPFINQQGVQYEVLPQRPFPVEGFAEQLIGMKGGEGKEFKLQLPKDYSRAELADKEAWFKVKVGEIKQLKLPELSDEFASLVDPDLKTLASLRERVSTNLKLRAEEKARDEYEQKAIEAVVGVSQVEFPPILVEVEIDRLLDQQARWLQASGSRLDEYLSRINKTGEQLREELRPLALKRVTSALVLEQISQDEKIEATDAEINAELEKLVQATTEKKDELKKFLDSPEGRHSMEQAIIRRKTLERIVEIARTSTEEKVK